MYNILWNQKYQAACGRQYKNLAGQVTNFKLLFLKNE